MEPSGVSLSLSSLGRRALVAGAITIVAACQAPAATTNPSGAPGVATPALTPAGPTASPSQAPGTGLGGLFHVVGSAPVIPRSMFPDRGAILPAAVMVAADGTYHAWVVAFGEPPGTQEIHHLTSADAVVWTDVPDASLIPLSEGIADPGVLPTSVLETADGWVMYAVASLANEPEGWDIWRATAPGPDGPWIRDDEPVLRRGPAGAWDAGALDFPSVVATDDGFAMFYSAIPTIQRETGSIGMATSGDGVGWTKHDDDATTDAPFADSDPVAGPGLCGGFDEGATHQPRVISGANGLLMVYAGYAGGPDARPGVGFANTLDGGLTWGCQWPANALAIDELPAGDGVHTLNAFMRGERVTLLIEWLMNDGTDVWLAHLGAREP